MSSIATQQISPEIDRAQRYIEQVRVGVIGATVGLSEAQWNFKPSPDRWSIAENLEHIVIVQEVISRIVQGEPAAAPIGDPAYIDQLILREFPNRLAKFKGPEITMPAGKVSRQECFERLAANSALHARLAEAEPELRRRAYPAPPIKAATNGEYEMLDGFQWLLAATGHTARHTHQMLEVKADPNFPAA
jgi:DinB superfamily